MQIFLIIIIIFILYNFLYKNNDNFKFGSLSEYDESLDGKNEYPYLKMKNYKTDILKKYYLNDDTKDNINAVNYLNDGKRISGVRTVIHPYQRKTGKNYGKN